MRLYLLGFLVIANCFYFDAWAESSTATDSLKKLLNSSIHDTIKVETLFKLSEQCYLTSPAEAIKYCEEAKILSEKVHYSTGLTTAYGWLAYLHEQTGNIGKALEYNFYALDLARKNKNKKDEAVLLGNIAAIFKDQGKIEDALKYNFQSLEIRKSLNDSAGISTIYNNIGLIFSGQGRTAEAIDYYMRSLIIEERLKSPDGIITALQNIGAVYREQKEYENAFSNYRRACEEALASKNEYSLGYIYNGLGGLHDENGHSDSALYYFNKAMELRKKLDDKQGIAYTRKNAGMVYQKLLMHKEAEESFRQSLTIFKELGDKLGIAIASNLLGALLLDNGREAEAETLLNLSLNTANELGFPLQISHAAGNLQRIYRKKGAWQQALIMNDLFIKMRDSVESDMNRKAALKARFKYEFEKKEAQLKSEQEKKEAVSNAEIKRNRQQKYFLIAGLLMALSFAYLDNKKKKRIANEKKRSDELLLNILPAEVAEELKEKGHADAKHFEQVTVMFTDFKNFTAVAEQLSAQELVNEINYCYSEFDKIISKYGLEKIKTIGDAYMCAGGLPVPNTTNAEDTVGAAMEIRDFMLSEKRKREANGKTFFEIRIGIHTGPVVAGIVGIKKFAYDIWGDTVNIASRMESSGEAGKVNISGTTYELVKDKFKCEHRGKIQAKHKGEIDMYFVENA